MNVWAIQASDANATSQIRKRTLPPHLAHLANATSLTEGADGPHVALVPGAKLGGVVVGGRVQGNAWMHISGGLQMVALTEQR